MTWHDPSHSIIWKKFFLLLFLCVRAFLQMTPWGRKTLTWSHPSYPVPSIWSLSWAPRVFRIWSYLLQLCLLHFHWGMMLKVYVTTVSGSKNRGFISQESVCVCVCGCVCVCARARARWHACSFAQSCLTLLQHYGLKLAQPLYP